jgi:hypothetical protein
MAVLTVTDATDAGPIADISAGAQTAAAGDQYPADDRTFLVVITSSAQCVVTIAATRSSIYKEGFGTVAVTDQVVTVATGDTAIIPVALGTHGSGGIVSLSYSSTSGVTVNPVRLGRL